MTPNRIRPLLFLLAAVGALAAVLTVAGASSGSTATSARVKVSVKDNKFVPKSTTVSKGGKVTWVWRGQNDHTVTFTKVPRGASKRSAGERSSGHFTRSFTKRGTYRYICEIHAPNMKGSVTVR
jgi:plastocyanin